MTEELKQAISALQCAKRGHCDHAMADEAIAALEALTQPAAQTEREAFEAWFDDYYDKACAEFGGIDCTDPKGIAEDAWQAHASLPAPQQATPEPVGEALQFPPMPEGWPARFRCDSCDGNGELGELVSMGDFQPPERQTCPDCGGRGWTSEEHAFNADHMREFAEAHALLTRPAPGVPEGFALVPVAWPLRARVWKRESTQEWVLEIAGTLGDTDMNIRHTQPLSVAYENVPGLPAFYTRPAPGVPDVEAAAKKLAECMDYPWEHMPSAGRDNMRKHAEAVLAAAQAKGADK